MGSDGFDSKIAGFCPRVYILCFIRQDGHKVLLKNPYTTTRVPVDPPPGPENYPSSRYQQCQFIKMTSNSRGSDAGKVRARLDARRVKRQRAAPADLGLARVAEARVHEPEADDGHSAVQVHVDRAVLELAVDRAPAHVPGNEGRQAALVRRGQLVGQPPDVRP